VKKLGLRVTVIQPKTTNNFEKNLENIRTLLNKVSPHEPDLITLPEAWQHSNIFAAAHKLADNESLVVNVLAKHAEEMNAVVVGGGLVVYRCDGFRMAAPVIGPDGSVMGWQEKIHLHKSEKHLFKHGESIQVFKHKGICFGVQICLDIAFPEISRVMALRGADLIVNPSHMPSRAVEPWHDYMRARCLENRVTAAGANMWTLAGGSVIMDLVKVGGSVFHVREHVAPDGEGVVVDELEPEKLRGPRMERLASRIPSIYSELADRKQTIFYGGEE